ncbi:hypothetical protein ACIP98_04090 [Streptomyces sp. NPDC088354]|uniref:hypothetical protein n=1 Tax=unclassified Streptomyces TaxID=2593676 RepID=UPI0029B16367|nr:hypothetical protein [Streptomyces sp. MI02-7b]MDX3070819.1 hypothetical protein [Streptomyces sp. MI02-7b]
MERDRARPSRETAMTTEELAQPREQFDAPPGRSDTPRAPAYPGEGTESVRKPSEPPAEMPGAPAQNTSADQSPQLLTSQDEESFRARWQEIQSEFVDDPRDAVHTADALVADVMQKLAATFAHHKQELEGQWDRGEQVDTEDLRTALRQYRSFFNRLLTT